jgi:hypothetical protein
MYTIAIKNASAHYNPTVFTKEQLGFVLDIRKYTSNPGEYEGRFFLVNYKEPRYEIQGWGYYTSFSQSRNAIEGNVHLNLLYSSGYVEVLTTGGS